MPARLSRRGLLLLTLGVVFVVYGASILTTSTPPFGGFTPFGLAMRPWGAVWIGCGVLAVAASVLRLRWPAWDGVGFSALYVAPALWAFVALWSWIAYLVGFPDSNGRGWAACAIWIALIIIVLIVSGWPEPARRGQGRT